MPLIHELGLIAIIASVAEKAQKIGSYWCSSTKF